MAEPFRRLRRLFRRAKAPGPPAPARPATDDFEAAVEALRARGVRIGRDCRVFTREFSTEPWLVTLGDRVAVSGGVKFLTHDGSAWLLRPRRPQVQVVGTIEVGDDCYIGENALLLPGTRIGAGSLVAAGAVVRGSFPDNAVIAGNPARHLGRASLLLERLDASANALDTFGLPEAERRARLLRHFGLADGSEDEREGEGP